MSVESQGYGHLDDGREVELFTLTNPSGMRARVTNFGAILVGLDVPDRNGRVADVTLGFDSLAGWMGDEMYLGATVGRFGNRIGGARFTLDGKTYQLAKNKGENHLHGGEVGFNKRLWTAEPFESEPEGQRGLRMHYDSPDGEENYPGLFRATTTYTLTDANELIIEMAGVCDAPTIVNMVHHSYWNLTGDPERSAWDHELVLHANEYVEVDDEAIPTGRLIDVADGPMDFRQPHRIADRIEEAGGYDHCWVLQGEPGKLREAAMLRDPASGRTMTLLTDQPGVQFYAGLFLDGSIIGKGGRAYEKGAGLCLETEVFPDAPNHPHFPSAVLRPGQTYRHVMVHRFSAE